MDAHRYVFSLIDSRIDVSYMQGLELSPQDIQVQLSRRRPGQSQLTTPVCIDSFLSNIILDLYR